MTSYGTGESLSTPKGGGDSQNYLGEAVGKGPLRVDIFWGALKKSFNAWSRRNKREKNGAGEGKSRTSNRPQSQNLTAMID